MATPASPARAHPDTVLDAVKWLNFACPVCHGDLQAHQAVYECAACTRRYPVHHGIPDFRVLEDPYLSRAEDLRRSDQIVEILDRCSFPELLEFYWRLSDYTPEPLWRRYVSAELRSETRGRRVLDRLSGIKRDGLGPLIDVGCGTGGALAAAARNGIQTAGADVAMRWLHVLRRRFIDAGMPEPALVCCCAEALPFADGSFNAVICTDTLEFSAEQGRLIRECARVVQISGVVGVGTANRFSILRDPYSSLWGVGFLPRPLQAPWVRWRRRAHYEQVSLVSLGRMRKLASDYFRKVTVEVSEPARFDDLPPHYHALYVIYRKFATRPRLMSAVKHLVPHWDVLLTEPRKGQHGR